MTAQDLRPVGAGTGPEARSGELAGSRVGTGVATPPGSDAPAVAPTLATRLAALGEFVRAAAPYLPAARLRQAREITARADQRLELSQQHTVVALAGATGGGKSSLFNALAGRDLSPVGVRRPTTGEAYACVWGQPDEATDLLDWLKVPPGNRFSRPGGDGLEAGALRGLVLLDLPDCDSVERDHAAEVDRVLDLVDVVIWVVDPQKYADRAVHEQHLPRFRRHREVTVVALNQADLVTATELDQLLADLRRLLAADGLEGVLTIATSAVDAPAGLAQLRARLGELLATRRATIQRLAGDVDAAVEDLAATVGPPAALEVLAEGSVPDLTEGLARVAGVTAVAEYVERTYRRRATAATTWPLVGWLRRLRPDPARHLAVAADGADEPDHLRPAPSLVSQRAAAGTVARTVAARLAEGLPDPWPDAVTAAARSRLTALSSALRDAVRPVARGPERAPVWWRLVAWAQWLALAAVAVGLGWLLAANLLSWAGMVNAEPGPAPLLLAAGGAAAGPSLALLSLSVARAAARRARTDAAARMWAAVATAGHEQVTIPMRAVLEAYQKARKAMARVRGTAM